MTSITTEFGWGIVESQLEKHKFYLYIYVFNRIQNDI